MIIAALIPARYNSTRFPGKMMAKLGNQTVILSTYKNTVATNLFDMVYVVTDSDIIFKEIQDNDGNVIRSNNEHSTGSDRIAEACQDLDIDIVVNVQGDAPFINFGGISGLIAAFNDPEVQVATLIQRFKEKDDFANPNNVKVVMDKFYNIMYFSRANIPYNRNSDGVQNFYEHIGVYAFRKKALMEFTSLPQTINEKIECLEQLRLLENGYNIRAVEVDYMGIEIDTPEDLVAANQYLAEHSFEKKMSME
ncbi:MAG: 3-deoxy-manno-octulosonate cytidylyltransferase [Candidatus Kapabacteria bacterium]|nr:3-deoxy-manno-octulosonate cytidylyltransferase [Candidatus Kapabacteria bacterium]